MLKTLQFKWGFRLSLIICCMLIWGFARAQSRTLTGIVKDNKSNEVMPGVNVLVKGTASGTITDANGEFSLTVTSDSDILIFSFVGYKKTEMQVGSNATLQISLETDLAALEEVVVVGYGEQKKSNVTGAISSVKSQDLQDLPNPRMEDALKGRAAGVTITSTSGQPGAAASIMIRGVTSINNSDPLIVVDGIPVGGGFDYLNSADIESIEILKDAASAAIYGTKAASGVILITTKKGKAGTIRANVNSYFGSQQPAHKLSLLNANQYATLRNESVLGAGGTSLPFANPAALGKGTDWQSQVFNDHAYIQNTDLNVSGGTDKSTYYSSVSYYRQEGIVTPAISNYSRLTARINSTHKVTNWLNFGQNLSYTYTKSMGVDENNYYGGVLGSAVNIDPVTPVVDPGMDSQDPSNPYKKFQKFLMRDPYGNPYAISKYVGQEVVNPLALLRKNRGNGYGWSDKIVGNFYLEVEPIKGLKLRTNAGVDLAFWGSESFTPLFYLSATQNDTTNTHFNRGMNKALNWIWTNTATYSRSIGEHNFNVTLGTEARSLGNGINVGAVYDGLSYGSLGQASMNNVNPKTLPNYIAYGGEYQPYTIASLFGRVNYDLRGKYLFTGVIRRDGSSHFGANKKYGVFPSVSVGWVPSMESFWPSNNIVDFLKLRLGYGVNGNDNLDPFKYVSVVGTVGTYPVGGSQLSPGYAPLAPANPNLHWEQTSQTNFAIDAVLMSNITLSIDFFQKKTKDMLMQIQPPLFAGATQSPWGNIATMKNHGVEVTAGYRKQLGQVGLNVSGNFTYVRNTVTQLDGVHQFFTYGSVIASSAEISRKAVGQPINAFYGYQRMGLFQTQADVDKYVNKDGTPIQPNAKPGDVRWADLNGDGKIDDKDRTYLGDPTPHYIFGFTVSATYKNFDLKIFAQGVAGNKIYQALRRLDITTANYSTKALGRWTGPGTSNDYPRLADNDPNGNFTNPSSFHLQNGSFLRLKTIQLGYNFPKALISKAAIQNARLYVSVNNVYTFTKYNGFDPEIGGGLFGQDHGIYPQARSFMVGFNVTF